MKKFKDYVKEDGAAPANSMGTAGTAGLGPATGGIAGFDPLMMGGKILRRKLPTDMVKKLVKRAKR